MVFWRKKKKPAVISFEGMSESAQGFMAESSGAFVARYTRACTEFGFDDVKEWNAEQDTGEFAATTSIGTFTASFQALASWERESNSWEWCWNNPHVEEALKEDSKRVKEYGEREKIDCLTTGMASFPDDPKLSKQMSLLLIGMASKIAESEAIFFGEMGPTVFHLGLKNIKKVED